MKMTQTSSASQEMAEMILAVVNQIPYAKVATYGQIARLAGLPKHARLVGRVLSHLESGHRYSLVSGDQCPGENQC